MTPETENRKKAFIKFSENEAKLNELKKYLNNNVGEFFFLMYDYSKPFMNSIYNEYEGHKANPHIIRFMILASYLNRKNNLSSQ